MREVILDQKTKIIMAASIFFGLAVVIWGVGIIGHSLPSSHRYAGGWIFGMAWLPIITYAVVDIIVTRKLRQRGLVLVLTLFLPYVWVLFAAAFRQTLSFEAIVVQAGMIKFAGAMLGICLQALVLPFLLRTKMKKDEWAFEYAIPLAFVFIPGLILSFYAGQFLFFQNVLLLQDIPFLLLGVLQSGVMNSIDLYKVTET